MKRSLTGDAFAMHVAHVGPAEWGRNGAGGVYKDLALWGEADILGHLAMRKRQFGGALDDFVNTFYLRGHSGERERWNARVDTPYRR